MSTERKVLATKVVVEWATESSSTASGAASRKATGIRIDVLVVSVHGSEDLATGTERSIVEALVASTRQVVAEMPAEAEGDVDGAAAAPAGGARGEVRRPGRRPATRKAASVTKKSPALPASSSTRVKKGALVDLAKGAMAQQDAATSGTRVRRANVNPKATASAARRPAKKEASRKATASKKGSRRSEARKSSKGSR